jgi:hypothetical protein
VRPGRAGSAPPLTQALGDAVLAMVAVLRAFASCAWDIKPEQHIRRFAGTLKKVTVQAR